MPRVLNEEEYQKAIRDGKINRKATVKLWRREAQRSSEESLDHPLVEQGKALQQLAGEMAAAIATLSRMVEVQGKMIGQMMLHMGESKKRKPWKFKVNRNHQGFMESVDVVPVEEYKGFQA